MKRCILIYTFLLCFFSETSWSSSEDRSDLFYDGAWLTASGSEQQYYYNEDVLFLSGHSLQGKLDFFVESHPTIQALYLHNCGSLEPSDMGTLQDFKNLTHLKLAKMGVTDNLLKALFDGQLASQLKVFEAEDHFITDAGIVHMSDALDFSSLKKLSLTNSTTSKNITARGLNYLSESQMAMNLDLFCVTIDETSTKSLSTIFFSTLWPKCSYYEKFYDERAGGLETYFVYDPGSKDYIWRFFDGNWYICSNRDRETTVLLQTVSDKLLQLEKNLLYEEYGI